MELQYLPERISFADLVDKAKQKSCTTQVFTTTKAQLEVARSKVGNKAKMLVGKPKASKQSDQLYYLKASALRYLPLTPLQARRVNAALWTKRDAAAYLSPRQIALIAPLERALDADKTAFEGLQRPSTLDGLVAYEQALRERLSAADD